MEPNHCSHVINYWNEVYQINYWKIESKLERARNHILNFCLSRIGYYLRISK